MINQEYLDGKKSQKENVVPKKDSDSYYGFNSHHIPVNYFEEKTSKEIFHTPTKKIKKKKSVKIYKKLPKKVSQERQGIQGKKDISKDETKVKSKKSTKVISYKGVRQNKKKNTDKDKKHKVRVLKPSTKTKKETKTTVSEKSDGKPKYDPIHWPKDQDAISKIDIEKDIAYLKQDLIKKDRKVIDKLKPKNTSSTPTANIGSEGKINTYDVESKPIPLPFK